MLGACPTQTSRNHREPYRQIVRYDRDVRANESRVIEIVESPFLFYKAIRFVPKGKCWHRRVCRRLIR